jgi:hypothetical protein
MVCTSLVLGLFLSYMEYKVSQDPDHPKDITKTLTTEIGMLRLAAIAQLPPMLAAVRENIGQQGP